MKTYNPLDWYWQAADGRIYSSERQKLVKANDKGFSAWKADETNPSGWPKDEDGHESDQEFAKVLAQHGLTLPGAELVPASVTEAQFMRAAVRPPFSLVTADEAEGYLARGELPAFVVAALATIKDEAKRLDARLTMIGASTFERANPLFALLIESGVATAEQVDSLFVAAGQITA